jgi:hypothetical protein
MGGFSIPLCYLITAQQFQVCLHARRLPSSVDACPLTVLVAVPLPPPIVIRSSDSLSLGVLLGGIGDGKV